MKLFCNFLLVGTLFTAGVVFGAEPVRQAQDALRAQGFDPGRSDGVVGPKTRAAIRRFQQQNHITPNGRLGGETYEKLGVKRDLPAKKFDSAGSHIKNSYAKGGKDIGQGGKDLGADIKHGQVTDAAKDFGTGVGHGAKKMGVGTAKATKDAARGVKDAFTPHDKKSTGH